MGDHAHAMPFAFQPSPLGLHGDQRLRAGALFQGTDDVPVVARAEEAGRQDVVGLHQLNRHVQRPGNQLGVGQGLVGKFGTVPRERLLLSTWFLYSPR